MVAAAFRLRVASLHQLKLDAMSIACSVITFNRPAGQGKGGRGGGRGGGGGGRGGRGGGHLLTLSLKRSKGTFSQPFKERCIGYDHLSSE